MIVQDLASANVFPERFFSRTIPENNGQNGKR
jgi:hypothetical protein